MKNNKKILFFNAKRDKCASDSPHLGLAMLAGVLKNKNHDVLVVDYQFKPDATSPLNFVKKFEPDVIGITLYTATMKEGSKIINELKELNIPLILGGPHATLYYDDMICESDYIVVGEAENIINNLVQNAKKNTQPKIIFAEPPDPKLLPFPDFTSFIGYEDIHVYTLITSRGCPYNCSFCAVHLVSTKKWRPRLPEECIEELINAKRILKNLDSVIIYDDNPMFRKNHILKFLHLYLKNEINLPLNVINTRADSIDDEMVQLLKKARSPSIGLGVESGHPEVFNKIKKGEKLEDIINASKIVKKYKIPLALSFVIGLEDDSYERTLASIDLAKKIKPDHIYWNMITPFKGTQIRDWYDNNGQVFDLINNSSYVDGDFMCEEPCAETRDFSIEERKKAYILAILETNDTRLKLRDIFRLYSLVIEYGFYKEFLYWIPKKIVQNIKNLFKMFKLAKNIYSSVGFKGLLKRINKYY